MKIKLISILIAAVMVLSALAGCAGKDGDTDTLPDTDTKTAVTDDTAALTDTENGDTTGADTAVEPVTDEPTGTDPAATATDTDSETEQTTQTDTEPDTTVPTTEPEMTVPATEPETTAPVTTAPVTTAPVTTAPVTTAPVTTEPVTTAPETTVPVTTEPVTTAPETTAPDTGTVDPQPEPPEIVKLLPADSSSMSADLARKLLTICTGGNESSNASLLREAGFQVVMSKHYEKGKNDKSHNSAFTVGKLNWNGKNYYAIVIRGTSGGEWYSNFDFAPSHSDDTEYAENFLLAAQDVYLSIKNIVNTDKTAKFIICGHSRGAATANLLGVLLDEVCDPGNVYVYTYATPNTVRGEMAKKEYKNIFNFINDNDVVTRMPLKEHGFSRAGTDIKLSTTPSGNALLNNIGTLAQIAPTINAYYTEKHSTEHAGLSEDGMTVYELMCVFASILAGDGASTVDLDAISPDSDLYPFVSLINGQGSDLTLILVGVEHLPTRYQSLMKKLK